MSGKFDADAIKASANIANVIGSYVHSTVKTLQAFTLFQKKDSTIASAVANTGTLSTFSPVTPGWTSEEHVRLWAAKCYQTQGPSKNSL